MDEQRIRSPIGFHSQSPLMPIQIRIAFVSTFGMVLVVAWNWRRETYLPVVSASPKCRNPPLLPVLHGENHIDVDLVKWIFVSLLRRVSPLRRLICSAVLTASDLVCDCASTPVAIAVKARTTRKTKLVFGFIVSMIPIPGKSTLKLVAGCRTSSGRVILSGHELGGEPVRWRSAASPTHPSNEGGTFRQGRKRRHQGCLSSNRSVLSGRLSHRWRKLR